MQAACACVPYTRLYCDKLLVPVSHIQDYTVVPENKQRLATDSKSSLVVELVGEWGHVICPEDLSTMYYVNPAS